MTLENGATGLLSGISIVGGYRKPQLQILATAGQVTVEDCGFYFSYAQGTAVAASSPAIFRRCSFRFHEIPYGGGVLSACNGSLVEDCLFSDNTPARYYGQQLVSITGANARMKNCVFRRNIVRYTDNVNCGPIGGVLKMSSGAVVEGSVFSNNYITVSGTYNLSLIEVDGAHMERCVVKDNLMRVNPCQNLTYAFAQATYAAFNNSFDGCTFSGNVIEGISAPTGDFAMSMIANSVESAKLAVVNCTFYSNTVGSVGSADVTASLSRGLLTRANSNANSASQLGIANCTFIGPAVAGVKDVIQLGLSHSRKLNIVNCYFETDSVTPVNPFGFAVPGLAVIRDCTIKNMLAEYQPQAYDLTAGLRTDAVPHVSDGLLYRPAAKTPGIRSSSDVAETDALSPRAYQFRPQGDAGWTPLVDAMKSAVSADPAPISDAAGTLRSFGAITRGAIQTLAEPAETGVTLTVRVNPLTGGTVSNPSTQSTAANGSIVPVRAVAESGCSFGGWYTEDSTAYSDSPVLEIETLESDIVLIADFATRSVAITFDLSGRGLFTENNRSTISVSAKAGDPFPSLPACTINDGYILYGVNAPTVVPSDSDRLTIYPEIITKNLRSVFVTPTGAGAKNGSDWDNALDSVSAAIAEAGKYRGEVLLGAGKYVFSGPVALKSNVAIRGGFGGRTVLTGDVNANDTWVGVLNGATAEESSIWDYANLAYSFPNPNGAHDYWRPTGNISDNTLIGFTSPDSAVTNITFSGITMTGFRGAAIYSAVPWSDISISNCVFVANGGSTAKDAQGTYYRSVHAFNGGPFEMTDTEFVGNSYAAYFYSLNTAGISTNRIHDCRFVGNNTHGLYVGTATGTVSFVERISVVSNGVANLVTLNSTSGLGRNYLTDSFFRANILRDKNAAVTASVQAGQLADCTYISRCLFEDNVLHGSVGTLGVETAGGEYHNVYVTDSCWLGNTLNVTGGVNDKSVAVAGRTVPYSHLFFVDCSFVDNAIVSRPYVTTTGRAGILAKDQHWSRFAAVNCSFKGNKFTPGHEANEAECVLPVSCPGWKPLVLVNCAIDNSDGHLAYRGVETSYASMKNCVVSSFDISESVTGIAEANFATNGLVIANPGLSARCVVNPEGLKALGLGAQTSFRGGAYPLAMTDSGWFYYYDTSAAKPWVALGEWQSLSADQAADNGVSLDSLKPDALGRTRTANRFGYGPLNAVPARFLLLIK